MGNDSSKQHRRWFEQIDADKDGDLGLRELLEIQKLEGDIHKSVLTPSLLFRFDGDQDGSLDVRDFDKLMKHLRKEKGKRPEEPKPPAPPGEEVWAVLDQRRASLMNFSRDGDTPLITGQGHETAETAELLHALEQAERRENEEKKHRSEANGFSAGGAATDGSAAPSPARGAAATAAAGARASPASNGTTKKRCSDSDSDSDDDGEDPRAQATPTRSHRRRSRPGIAAKRGKEDEEEEEEDEDEDENSSSNVGPSESVDQEATGQEGEDEAQRATALVEEAALIQIPEAAVEDDDDTAPAPQALSVGVASPPRVGSVSPTGTTPADKDSAKIIEESQHNLMEILSTPAGKKKYMKWLFRLADADKKGRVNVEELSMILRALAMDGLALSELSFEAKDDQTTDYMDIARRIMAEFDTGKDGVLSEQEFHVLADLIVRKYAARTSEDKIVLDRYRIKRILGQGAMGVVKLATNLKSGKQVAIKMIDSSHVSDFSKIDLEIKAMLMLRHPNVVRLFKVLESNNKIYLVMELCGGGTLADMVRIKPLSESLARFYMRQLIPAIKYCHTMGVTHRDIKLENLLLTNRGNLKISDFGHAGIYRQGWDLFSTSLVGSLWHISPEQVSGTVYKGAKIDIWALGVVLYRLLSGGRPPFYSDVASEVLDAILHARFSALEHVSAEANDLIRKILVVDPNERPSLREISEHPWMKYGEESVPRLEAIDLILSDSTDVEKQWAAMCAAATELQVVFTVPIDRKRQLEIHRMMCHYPTAEMKFAITMLRVSASPADPPFFEFVIRAGETSEFQNLVEQLRKCFKLKLAELLGAPLANKSLSKASLSAEARKILQQSSMSLVDSQDTLLSSSERVNSNEPLSSLPSSPSSLSSSVTTLPGPSPSLSRADSPQPAIVSPKKSI